MWRGVEFGNEGNISLRLQTKGHAALTVLTRKPRVCGRLVEEMENERCAAKLCAIGFLRSSLKNAVIGHCLNGSATRKLHSASVEATVGYPTSATRSGYANTSFFHTIIWSQVATDIVRSFVELSLRFSKDHTLHNRSCCWTENVLKSVALCPVN